MPTQTSIQIVLLLACFGGSIVAQERPPKLLNDAASCLVTGNADWLGLNELKAGSVTLGFIIDTKSWPGEKHVFVAAYTQNRGGNLFDFKVERSGEGQSLTIQNNLAFVRSRSGVSFVEPPLGGVWTEQLLDRVVKQIALRPRFILLTKDLKVGPKTDCRSYADRR